MFRCAAVARVAAGAATAKQSTHDLPHLTRILSIAPSYNQIAIRASSNYSVVRGLATKAALARASKKSKKAAPKKTKPVSAAKADAPKKARAKGVVKKKAAVSPKKGKAVAAAPKRLRKKKKIVVVRKAKKVSERQKTLLAAKKQRDDMKAWKEKALTEPKNKPANAWLVFFTETTTGTHGDVTENSRAAGLAFKALAPSELEKYQQIADSNKAANEATYKAWVNSYTPEQIRIANITRHMLKRRLAKQEGKVGRRSGRGLSTIKDERQTKRPTTAYVKFAAERRVSGDFKNIALGTAARSITKEWKELAAGDKKKYEDLVAADRLRYVREYSSTYGHPPALATSRASQSPQASA